MYGKELILDLHACNVGKFNRIDIRLYFKKLCKLIDMSPQDLYFWDYEGVAIEDRPTEPHLLGTSAVQFIETSNVTIHALELLKHVYINIFSCKDFDAGEAKAFTANYFEGKIVAFHVIDRI